VFEGLSDRLKTKTNRVFMAQKREICEVVEPRKLLRVTHVLTALPQSDPRDLVLQSLPFASEMGGEKRHTFQTEMLKMAGEMLNTVHSTAVETRKGFVAHAAQVKANSDAATEAFAACKQQQQEAAMKRDELAALALQAEEAHANAEYEQSRSETARSRIMEERNALEIDKENSEKFLEEGWEGMDMNLVQEQLKSIGAEPALIAAVPGALAVPPEQRGAFDALTTQALISSIKEGAEKVDSFLSKNQEEERYASSFALGAWAFADVAKGQASAAADKVAESEKSLALVMAELEHCSNSVTTHEKALQASAREQTLADEKVQEINSAQEELQEVLENDSVPPVTTAPEPLMENNEVPVPNLVVGKHEDLPASPNTLSLVLGGC